MTLPRGTDTAASLRPRSAVTHSVSPSVVKAASCGEPDKRILALFDDACRTLTRAGFDVASASTGCCVPLRH